MRSAVKTSLKRRALAAVYAEVQNRPALKRLAVRLMMRFPALGARAMAAVAPAARAPVRRGGTVDAQARAVYLEQGYRPLLLGEAPAAANAAPRRRLLVDMSGLVERDARTGIQRVVRNLTRALAMLELPGWRVEPVYEAAGVFRYARRFVAADWQLPELGLDDEVIEAGPGDVFFTADLALLPIAAMHQPLRDLRARGVAVHFVLHDLIPVSHPQFYQGEIDPRFMRWLDIMLDVADGIWCVSSAVADELRAWLQAHPQKAPRGMPRIGWFHLGAELPRPGRTASPC